MAERDPDTIKKDIDAAREQLASTVDILADRANPATWPSAPRRVRSRSSPNPR